MSEKSLRSGPPDVKDDKFFQLMTNRSIRQAAQEGRLLCINFEITSRCAGSCNYCYSSSNDFNHVTMAKETVFDVIDQVWDLGVRHITWVGGDPLLHPDFFEIIEYSGSKGIHNFLVTSGLVTQKMAQKIAEQYRRKHLHMVSVHLDTINPEVYARIYNNPKGLSQKIQGFRNMAEAGFPPELTALIICLTSESVKTIEETLDWFFEELRTRPYWVDMLPFKPEGYGDQHRNLEPSLSDIRRAFEYRAKKVGAHWLQAGVMDSTRYFCQTYFYLTYDGLMLPCAFFRDRPLGNIYEKRIANIVEHHKNELLFHFPVKGKCGECENNDVCWGCRANAYRYLGDPQAADPKCWMNPEAKERYFG